MPEDRPQTLATAVSRLYDAVVALLLAAVVGTTGLQVLARYALDVTLPWSEELNRFLFVWMVMLAAARATHMRIEALLDSLPARPRVLLQLSIDLLSLLLLALLLDGALVLMELTVYDRFTALRLPLPYLFLSLATGAVLWGAAILLRVIATLRGTTGEDDRWSSSR